jgi:hypothetical protein
VACCTKCNLAKHKMDEQEFVEWVLLVAEKVGG